MIIIRISINATLLSQEYIDVYVHAWWTMLDKYRLNFIFFTTHIFIYQQSIIIFVFLTIGISVKSSNRKTIDRTNCWRDRSRKMCVRKSLKHSVYNNNINVGWRRHRNSVRPCRPENNVWCSRHALVLTM